MPLDTSMAGVAPWLNREPDRPTNTGPAVQGFLGAFERAQERNSPLFRLKLEELGLQMQRDKLLHEMDVYKKNEMVAGMAAASEMAAARAKVTDPTDEKWVADQWAIAAKHPNPVAIKMAQDAEETRKAALAAKDRSDKILADIEIKTSRAETERLRLEATQAKLPISAQEAEYLKPLRARANEIEKKLKTTPEEEFPGQFEKLESERALIQSQIKDVEAKRPAHDTLESKASYLANLEEGYQAAVRSGDPAVIQQAKNELDAARAFVPANRLSRETELIVKDIGNGTKVVYAQGSNQLHIIRKEADKNTFMTKWVPQFMRDGKTVATATQQANDAWNALSETTGPTAAAPAAGKFVVGRVYTDKNGNKAVYQADGTWKEVR